MNRLLDFLVSLPSKLVGNFGVRWGFFSVAVKGAFLAGLVSVPGGSLKGYALENKSWPANTNVILRDQLGSAGRTLQDGNTSWSAAVAPVFEMWNSKVQRVRLTAVTNSTSAVASGDGVNSLVFASSVFGESFGSQTLAVTYYTTQGSDMIEADVLFNRAMTFDSYRGPLQFGSGGYAIADIRRVLLHELGHAIGLGHPDSAGQHVDAIMNSVMSNREVPSADDVSGAQSIYGAPAAPTPTPPPNPNGSRLANISTRLQVGTNENVLIGGFIITGTQPKKLLLRAIGPSLAAYGIAGTLANPALELRNSVGALVAANDNWTQSAQVDEISASGIAPTNSMESAILMTLAPGSYTAIVRGVNNTTGVGLVEGYELDAGASKLANISTRGRVGAGQNALIGGFIVNGSAAKKVMIRALGPSLGAGPDALTGVLANPVLELRNASGSLIASNDDWGTGAQAAQISASGIAPSNARESAIMATIAPGNYTAVVRGVSNGVGVGLVDLFDLDN